MRRRDLVVDEETIYQFYASKIPEEIASRRSFEDWRATVEANNPRYLFIDDDALWLNDRPTTQQFPDHLHNGQLRLATTYHFDPSHDEDGATVQIPVQALPQVDENIWSWGIPGWRQDLVRLYSRLYLKTSVVMWCQFLIQLVSSCKGLMQYIYVNIFLVI